MVVKTPKNSASKMCPTKSPTGLRAQWHTNPILWFRLRARTVHRIPHRRVAFVSHLNEVRKCLAVIGVLDPHRNAEHQHVNKKTCTWNLKSELSTRKQQVFLLVTNRLCLYDGSSPTGLGIPDRVPRSLLAPIVCNIVCTEFF